MKQMMERMNWDEKALHSEIEYSKALGGKAVEYRNFIYIYNKSVPWGGDFNRVVGAKISDFKSFSEMVEQVENIHKKKKLERPDRYDIYPPALYEGIWNSFLSKMGYNLTTVIFFYSPTVDKNLSSELTLYSPSESEYIEWFHHQQKTRSYFEEEWFQRLKPLKLNFIKIFKPYWLLRNQKIVGWIYCACFDEYCRLFEVEIEEECRGCGLGRILLDAIRIECGKQGVRFVLLQSSERLRNFYERSNFKECTKNSVIRLK